jgi:hypothetical protein
MVKSKTNKRDAKIALLNGAYAANTKIAAAWADWRDADYGQKPTVAHFDSAAKVGGKVGTSKGMALAMMWRKDMATQKQISNVVGGPHINCWRAIRDGRYPGFVAIKVGSPAKYGVRKAK